MVHGMKALSAAMLLALAGCATDGHNFDATRLSALTPGRTTMAQAAYELQAPPDKIYPQSDGTTLALWQFHVTFLTDGFYSRKEALLQFGPDSRLMRMVDSTNLLLGPDERRKLLGVTPPPPVGSSQMPPIAAIGGDNSGGPQTFAIPIPDAPPAQ